jgi:hypothetical protein
MNRYINELEEHSAYDAVNHMSRYINELEEYGAYDAANHKYKRSILRWVGIGISKNKPQYAQCGRARK